MCILIVDDDKIICEGIKSKLTRLGYQDHYDIYTAYSAIDAEVLYDQYCPEIVITDIQMPVINGLTLIERLNKRQKHTKIIVLSGYDDYEYVRKSFLLGASDYLLKPVDIEELAIKLSKVSDHIQENDTTQSKEVYNDSNIMQLALEYIDLNINKNISMRDVADNMFLSYNYFSALFKEYTGTYFVNYINERKVELSKKYLSDPSVKIKDIALKLGYDNPSVFSRVFKKHTGIYPTQYRKEQNNG